MSEWDASTVRGSEEGEAELESGAWRGGDAVESLIG